MNLTLRPSGGRGEYELAGRHGILHVHDLFNRPMFIDILPGLYINSYSNCVLKDGKPRIRLTEDRRNAHPYALIAGAMMLPKPRRERHETHGIELKRDCFVIQTVRINVIIRNDGGVLVSPVTVRLENADNLKLDIDFSDRMSRVVRVWTEATKLNDVISKSVCEHAKVFSSSKSTQLELVSAINNLYIALGEIETDILPILEKKYKLNDIKETNEYKEQIEFDYNENVEEINPEETRVERVRKWRLAAVRGGSSSTFRKKVTEAYDYRCMFSGKRLPRTDATVTAGVDAAHILPWSRYDLDSIENGLCLSKECHWAFDAGIFRLSFDDSENLYVISIPKEVYAAAKKSKFDIYIFESMVGAVEIDRLPTNKLLWPSKIYVKELNRYLDGKYI